MWFVESLFTLEENQTGSSLGRADQYLYPLYRHGIDNGVITEAEASELLCCWLIHVFRGLPAFINLVVGGQKRHGGDGCNGLTYMIMDASKDLGLYQPALATRIHNASPQKYLKKIVEVIKSGIGFQACHFDDMHIKHMDDEAHRRLTGACSRRILDNLRVLFRMGKKVLSRMPLLPGLNDDPAGLEAAFAMLREEAAQGADIAGAELLP